MNEFSDLKIDDIPISKTDEFNYLGLLVDKHLNWNAHINKIGNKLSKVIGILKRLNKYIPLKGLVIIYNSLFLPHLNYSSLVWGFNCDRILSLQKKVVRVICRAKYNAHTDPLFKKLKLLKMQNIIELKALKFFFKYSNNQLPDYFRTFFCSSPPTHSYYTRNRDNPLLPIPKRTRSEKSIRYFIPQLLDKLPMCIKEKISTHSYSGFSNYVKSFFINEYLDECLVPDCYVCNN